MALVINTNISSLTSQRALAESKGDLDTAMERLSTGLKINSASDDAAGLAMTQRMTAQVRGLSMAVKNANDGIAMTKSVEGAIGEVSDMLQRMRELAIQAANGTNSSADRTFLQNEVNLLIQEITRVSTNTRYNGELILDGTFLNKNLQVGIEEGEVITMSVESIAAERIGAHTLVGNGVGARPAQVDPVGNPTNIEDDIEIFGFLGTKSISASVSDTAKQTAVKINNLTGLTGVKAYAKTYASLYSASSTQQTYSVSVNGYTTGNFVISNGDVENAVDAINQISGSTGVTAHSEDNKVVLFDADGDDITIENLQTLAGHDDLRVRKIDESGQILQADGVTTNWIGAEVRLGVSSSTSFDSTRVTGTLKMTSPNAFSVDQKVRQLGAITGNTAKDHVDPTAKNITVEQAAAPQDMALYPEGAGTIAIGAKVLTNSVTWSGGNLNLAEEGMTNDEVAREIRLSSSADEADTIFTITGILADGSTDTETLTGVGTDTIVSGTKKFVTITEVKSDTNAVGKVSVGYGGLPSHTTSSILKVENLVGNQQYVVGDYVSFPGVETGSTAESPILHRVITAPDASGNPRAQTLTLSPPVAQDKASLTLMTGIAASATGIATMNSGGKVVSSGPLNSATVDLNPFSGNPVGYARAVTITTAAGKDHSAVTFTITGTDANGKVVTESMKGTTAAGSPATGLQKFVTVTAVTTDTNLDGAATIGYTKTDPPALTIETPGYAIDGAQTASLHNLTQVNISTMLQAGDSISIIDAALDKVAQMRANLGAIENRLDYTITNLMNIGERTADSRSRLLDADYALESSRLAKAQVIQQAGTQMLSQANQMTQMVLDLLR